MPSAPVTAALLAALPLEVRPFLRRVRARRQKQRGFPVWEFALEPGRGVAAVTGLGEAAALRAAALLWEYYQPRVIISLGFGGAVNPGLAPGAVVLGAAFRLYEPESGLLRELAASAPPAPLGELARRLNAAGLAAEPGSIVTTPYIIHKERQGGALRSLLHPVLDLETGALVTWAKEQGLLFLALRSITDLPDEEIPEFIGRAARKGRTPAPGTALAWAATHPRRLATLMRLWRRSRLAGRQLARALEVALEMIFEGGGQGPESPAPSSKPPPPSPTP